MKQLPVPSPERSLCMESIKKRRLLEWNLLLSWSRVGAHLSPKAWPRVIFPAVGLGGAGWEPGTFLAASAGTLLWEKSFKKETSLSPY